MSNSTPISVEVNKILQMVHDDAVRKNHDKLLGFSSRATERILDLIQKEREEARKEIIGKLKMLNIDTQSDVPSDTVYIMNPETFKQLKAITENYLSQTKGGNVALKEGKETK